MEQFESLETPNNNLFNISNTITFIASTLICLYYATGATASGLSAHAPHKGGQPGPLGRYMTTLVQVESGSGRLHIIIVHRCNNTRRKRNY